MKKKWPAQRKATICHETNFSSWRINSSCCVPFDSNVGRDGNDLARKGCTVFAKSMPGILWDQDTMVFFGAYPRLPTMLGKATKGWPDKTHEYQTYLASIVLSIESLGSDFAAWGTRYPAARQKADEILNKYFANKRTRLLDVYMPLRNQLGPNKLIETLGPQE